MEARVAFRNRWNNDEHRPQGDDMLAKGACHVGFIGRKRLNEPKLERPNIGVKCQTMLPQSRTLKSGWMLQCACHQARADWKSVRAHSLCADAAC